jgi:hypothetical protein
MAAKKKAAKKKTIRRTTLRSSKGTKLYAVRAADGTFKDIQTYKRAHAADIRKSSKAEATSKAAKKKKAPARKKAAAKKK